MDHPCHPPDLGKLLLLSVLSSFYLPVTRAQASDVCGLGNLPAEAACPLAQDAPQFYTAFLLERGQSITIDGKLDEPAWQEAEWTEPFVDIEGDGVPTSRSCRTSVTCQPRYNTQAKLRFDDMHLYIGAWLEDPDLWATLTEHNSVVFHDNDFEWFIDPYGVHQLYREWEVNQFNTTWQLLLPRPYCNGAGGCTLAVGAENCYPMPGLVSAVHAEGTINDNRDEDKGWSIELKVPWSVFTNTSNPAANAVTIPAQRFLYDLPASYMPANGSIWKINFSRVQWLTAPNKSQPTGPSAYYKTSDQEDNWVWSPQNTISMHKPERYGHVLFSYQQPSSPTQRTHTHAQARLSEVRARASARAQSTPVTLEPDWVQRQSLVRTYYALSSYPTLPLPSSVDALVQLDPFIVNGSCFQHGKLKVPTIHLFRSCKCLTVCNESGGIDPSVAPDLGIGNWCQLANDNSCVYAVPFVNDYFIGVMTLSTGATIRYDSCENTTNYSVDRPRSFTISLSIPITSYPPPDFPNYFWYAFLNTSITSKHFELTAVIYSDRFYRIVPSQAKRLDLSWFSTQTAILVVTILTTAFLFSFLNPSSFF